MLDPRINKYDEGLCELCQEARDAEEGNPLRRCLYHEGFSDGENAMRDAVTEAMEHPEKVGIRVPDIMGWEEGELEFHLNIPGQS